jgi:amicoumacin kinase
MHALARGYRPANPAWKRPEWDDAVNEFVDRYLPENQTAVKERYHALLDHLHALPRDETAYGLIHQDAHAGNMLVDEDGTLTLFDFDDCVYSWFANDIAIVLFYLVIGAQDAAAFSREFLTHFLRGYREVHELDRRWLKEIPHFLKLREMELYAVIHRDFDVGHIDDPWADIYMRGRKRKIETGVPFVDFDFGTL